MCNLCMNTGGVFFFMPKNLITLHTSKLAARTTGSLYCCLISMYTTLTKLVLCCQRSLHYTFPLLALICAAVIKNKNLWHRKCVEERYFRTQKALILFAMRLLVLSTKNAKNSTLIVYSYFLDCMLYSDSTSLTKWSFSQARPYILNLTYVGMYSVYTISCARLRCSINLSSCSKVFPFFIRGLFKK